MVRKIQVIILAGEDAEYVAVPNWEKPGYHLGEKVF